MIAFSLFISVCRRRGNCLTMSPKHQQGKEPEYLDYNIKGRGFWERMPYNAGALYITGEEVQKTKNEGQSWAETSAVLLYNR